ncbi:killer cell lectin-like receptor subfamily B member 1B allele C isoform X2 [Ambystoma mexicanum]|uniref:killer cell lectin-like receptor subfamily B member 1B allele C isoform X2 n=1 Tax=Ambystoma mexicanum TaxID=8296 RepID=UPI0037E8C8D1
MAGSVIYADLQLPEGSASINYRRPSKEPARVECPRWHRTALWTSGASVILLFLSTAVLSYKVFTYSQEEKPYPTQDPPSQMPLCRNGTVPANSLCPEHWLSYRGRCYYISKDKEVKTWGESHEDCSSRNSRLLLIEDQAQLDFINSHISHNNILWIGLFLACPGRKWTWVNGSMMNNEWLNVSGPAEEGSCGAKQKAKKKLSVALHSESCAVEAPWICEKEPMRI